MTAAIAVDDGVGRDAVHDLPARLLRRSTRADLGDGATLREFADPPAADFVLPPSQALTVVLVTRGSYVLETGVGASRRQALLRPGSSAVTAPGREVAARWNAPPGRVLRSVHLHVAAHLVDGLRDELAPSGAAPPDYLRRDDPFVEVVLGRLDLGLRRREPRLHLETLVASLVGHLVLGPDDRSHARRGGLTSSALQAVVDHMQDHLAEDVSVDELARVAHLSRHHFIRAFTTAAGTTPARHLTDLRMAEAKRLLRRDALPVHAVGTRVGYTNASAFTSAFRRATGTSPQGWRTARG